MLRRYQLSLGDIQSVVSENLSTISSLLAALRETGPVLVRYVLKVLWTGLSTTTSFVVTSVIFFTTLFYVLAASGNEFKPMEWARLRLLSMGHNHDEAIVGIHDSAIVLAIGDVFHSTIMVSLIHGLFTWTTMTLLDARWVHLSTILSFTFSMLPFVGPYTVVIPSAIDLYYRSDTAAPALLLGAASW